MKLDAGNYQDYFFNENVMVFTLVHDSMVSPNNYLNFKTRYNKTKPFDFPNNGYHHFPGVPVDHMKGEIIANYKAL